MRRLVTFRHAKSGTDPAATRDFDRALNAKGRRAAALMGRHMREVGLRFDAVLASPAVRVVETLEAMVEGYGRRLAPVWEDRLYLASPATMLEVVQETPDSAETLLLLGHNPGIEELVLLLSASSGVEEKAKRDSVGEKYPTASMAEIAFAVDRWRDVRPQQGRIVRFVRPRDLDPALGPETD